MKGEASPTGAGLESRVREFLWQHAPWRLYRHFRTWRPVRVAERTFRFPVLGGRHIPFELLEDQWRRQLLARLMPKDGGGFVDAGVNLGHTLIDLQCTAPMARYVGFEPNVACVDYVHELLRLNGITEWQVVPAALSSTSTVLRLWLRTGAETDEMATVIGGLRPEEQVRAEYVASLVFDDIRREVAPGPVRFVKIDVEGAELEVVRGMLATLREDRPLVLCEVLYPVPGADAELQGERNDALRMVLEGLGYVILSIRKTERGSLAGLTRVEGFPRGTWSAANKHECDYLFVPEEQFTAVSAAAGS
jgi:FkbM family methyltransferase